MAEPDPGTGQFYQMPLEVNSSKAGNAVPLPPVDAQEERAGPALLTVPSLASLLPPGARALTLMLPRHPELCMSLPSEADFFPCLSHC